MRPRVALKNPRGLKGEQIPLAARIFAIADVYDALTNQRPYRKAWTKERALKYIREQSGIHFDPQIAEKVLEIFGNPKSKGMRTDERNANSDG
jgi:putative two-component system response regulator